MEASPTGQGQHLVLPFFGGFKTEQIYKRVDFCPITLEIARYRKKREWL